MLCKGFRVFFVLIPLRSGRFRDRRLKPERIMKGLNPFEIREVPGPHQGKKSLSDRQLAGAFWKAAHLPRAMSEWRLVALARVVV